jgi:hypothetical protein
LHARARETGPSAFRASIVVLDTRRSAAKRRIVDDEIAVLRVSADIGADERAERHHPEAALPGVGKRAGDQRGPEASSLEGRVDFGVEERDDAAAPIAIDELPCVLASHE